MTGNPEVKPTDPIRSITSGLPSGSYRAVARIEMPSTATSTGREELAAKAPLKTGYVRNMP